MLSFQLYQISLWPIIRSNMFYGKGWWTTVTKYLIQGKDEILEEMGSEYWGYWVISYNRLKEKYIMEGPANFWKYLQIRDCIKHSNSSRHKPHKMLSATSNNLASRWYEMCPWTNKNTSSLRMTWGKDLGYTFNGESWDNVISKGGKFVREARGKFIQYKIINRHNNTPSRLFRMGLTDDGFCWDCKTGQGTYMHAALDVLDGMGQWSECNLQRSPWVCLLGDRSVMPQ